MLQLLAGNGENKTFKVRVRGYNSDGYGPTSRVYSYIIRRVLLPHYSLRINKSGSGTVTSNSAGITCGGLCTATYESGTLVTLTASPATDATFANWSGACTGSRDCRVTLRAATSVTAIFRLNTYPITAAANQTACVVVTCAPNPIPHDSSSTCTATPKTGYTFSAFSGACTGAQCVVTKVTAAKSLTAGFLRR